MGIAVAIELESPVSLVGLESEALRGAGEAIRSA